jgi:cytochrome b561
MSTPIKKYDSFTRALHWLIALILFTMIGLGISFGYVQGATFSTLMFIHKSLGMTLLFLVLIRLYWRLTFMRVPSYDPSFNPTNIKIAHIAHILLYLCLFIQPVSGWLGSSLLGLPVPFWGIDLALPLSLQPEVASWMFDVHGITVWVLSGLILLHILGAIFHTCQKEKIIQRML